MWGGDIMTFFGIGMMNFERLHLINSEEEEEDESEPENNMSHNKKKIGRNELCPCSSGLKYKKCCMGRVTY
jgi:uncharacterized protein YecA (UPF0149 family)